MKCNKCICCPETDLILFFKHQIKIIFNKRLQKVPLSVIEDRGAYNSLLTRELELTPFWLKIDNT